MGKAVLWRFSGFSTVLFNCTLEPAAGDGYPNPRFIGRTSLPWHRVDDEGKAFDGPGWFGLEQERPGRREPRAVSLRGEDAARAAAGLHLVREGGATGTSILVVGFHEPAEEDRSSLEDVAAGIAEAASEWFWPSLIGDKPSLEVEVAIQKNDEVTRSEVVDAEAHDAVKPFITAHRVWQNDDALDEPSRPGDVAAVPITVDLPAERKRKANPDPEAAQEAQVTLIVRLAEGAEKMSTWANHVAYFRGARMVVQYRRLRQLALSARDYHAMLVCGTARERYDTDRALERFLRAAEPPEHDRWDSTTNLKEAYKQGYKKALDEMDRAVRNTLRRLVTETPQSGAQGPDLFRKKFPIGDTGGGNGERSFVDLKSFNAWIEKSGKMRFEGRLRARATSPEVWEAALDFRIAEEDKRGDQAPVRGFATEQDGDVEIYQRIDGEGEVELLVSAGTRAVVFSGEVDLREEVADPGLASIDLEVNGHQHAS